MKQEDKDILAKNVCARIPYNLCMEYNNTTYQLAHCSMEWVNLSRKNSPYTFAIGWDSVKPYLFPLTSMTEEQKQEYTYIVNYISSDDTENWKEGEFIYVEQFTQLMHFYHINHLDYMGLIPMGLAIDATGLNIY